MNSFTRSALPLAANLSISSLPTRPTSSSCQRAKDFCENAFEPATQPAVDRLVHAEHDALTQHGAESGDDAGRRERQVIAQHLLGVLVAVHDEDRLPSSPGIADMSIRWIGSSRRSRASSG